MAETTMTVGIRAKILGVDEEIKVFSDKLVQLTKMTETVTGTVMGDLIDKKFDYILEKHKAEIEKAGQSAAYQAMLAGKTGSEQLKAKKDAEAAESKKYLEQTALGKTAKLVGAAQYSEVDKQVAGLLKDISGTLKGLADSGLKFVKQIFGIIEDVYKEMRNASPLLQTVERLFNLAWQLFFMPLGNKLGEIMIPAIVNMLDTVVGIWDAFDGMTLGEALEYAIEVGVSMIATYMKDLGTALADDTGIVKEIGEFLLSLGNFVEKNGEKLLSIVLTIATFVLENIGFIIVGIFELMLASVSIMASIQATQIVQHIALIAFLAAALTTPSLGVSTGAGAAALGASAGTAAAVPALVGSTVFMAGMGAGNITAGSLGLFDLLELNGMAEGGYVSATTGGSIVRVAEAGEGEWMIPSSKMDTLLAGGALPELGLIPNNTVNNINYDTISTRNNSSPTVVNITVNGYTDTDLANKIKDEVSGFVSEGRYRSGF